MHSLGLGISSLILTLSMSCNLIILMCFTYRNIEHLEDMLSDCRCINDFRAICQGGIIGRHMRFNMVMMVVTFPNVMYRRGDTTKDAHNRIPFRFKRWIWGIYIWLYLNAFCLVLLAYLIKVSREGAT
jgi:tellurite resistance protein TehA-like permease